MMAQPPDYCHDYKGDYSLARSRAFCSRAFIEPHHKLNGEHPDYGSHTHRCSQPVVTSKSLILNDFQPSRLLTTPLVSKEEYRRKSGVGKEYARGGSRVVGVTSQQGGLK